MQPTQKAISRMSCDSQGSTGPKKCLNTRFKSLHPSQEWNRQHREDYVLWLFSFALDTIWCLCCLCGRNSGWCSWMNPLYHDSQSIFDFMAVCQTWLCAEQALTKGLYWLLSSGVCIQCHLHVIYRNSFIVGRDSENEIVMHFRRSNPSIYCRYLWCGCRCGEDLQVAKCALGWI